MLLLLFTLVIAITVFFTIAIFIAIIIDFYSKMDGRGLLWAWLLQKARTLVVV